tara:strand:+ start:170 stop:451 length:282 start_codon:yes stop_codon:yes gene_type:complete
MFDIKSKVVCVDDRFPDGINDIYNALPNKGTIYTVRDIVPAQDHKFQGQPAILLGELVNNPNQHGIEPAFKLNRFREPTANELKLAKSEAQVN